MALTALGPLHLTHNHLWSLTWGEMDDLIQAYKYREYLEMQKYASLASWLLNGSGNLKHAIKTTDLIGHWVDGEVMDEAKYHNHLKQKIISKKRRRENGEEINL